MAGIKHAFVSAKTEGADATQVRTSNWNEEHDIEDITLPVGSVPSAPVSGVTLFGRNVGGRAMLAMMGPSGLDTAMQPHLARNKMAMWNPAGEATTITAFGAGALTATGSATIATVAVTNLHTMQKRLDYLVTTAATTAIAGFRYNKTQWTIGGSSAKLGGFHFVCRFGPATGVSTSTNRCFVGMTSSTGAPTDVQPSTLTNIVGVGWDSADTNIQIMYRGTGSINKIDTGIAVPTTDRTESYDLALFTKAGSPQEVGYVFSDLTNDVSASGTITSNLPSATTLLGPRGWMSAGGTSSVIGIALMSLYVESDY